MNGAGGIKVNFGADFSGMQRAIDAVSRESRRTGAEVVTLNGREFMKKVAFGTPGPPQGHNVRPKGKPAFFAKNTGTGRAGWTPGWTLVGLKGRPYTPRSLGQQKGKIDRYHAEGSAVDGLKASNPFIIVRNDTFVTAPKEPKKRRNVKKKRSYAGGKFNYLHRSNKSGKNRGWFQKSIDSVTFSFWRQHAKLLKKHSAKGAK